LIRRFFEYVEIRTKLASLLPFILALAYAKLAYQTLNLLNSGLFFIAMILFDMMTTALNNYMDEARNGAGLPFARRTARRIIFVLLFLATASGLALASRTGLIVLAGGALCFLAGIVYSYGPSPVTHLPLGEIFSGLFMGLGIPFLAVLVNIPPALLADYSISGGVLAFSIDLGGLLRLVLVMLPAALGIAAIMLANNLCDMERDRQKGRRTLPQIVGKTAGLQLFAAAYYIAFADIAVLAIFKILPLYILAALAALIPVQANISRFRHEQDKHKTFSLSIVNFGLLMLPIIIVALFGILFRNPA
jgi:1,4-dihydroxy-2-naphthoate polyprenyltransferase